MTMGEHQLADPNGFGRPELESGTLEQRNADESQIMVAGTGNQLAAPRFASRVDVNSATVRHTVRVGHDQSIAPNDSGSTSAGRPNFDNAAGEQGRERSCGRDHSSPASTTRSIGDSETFCGASPRS